MKLSLRYLVVLASTISILMSFPTAAAAEQRTVITLLVTGCEGCEIGGGGASRTVKGGTAALSVPTSTTRGMVFSLFPKVAPDDPSGGAGAATLVVLGDARRPGTAVSAADARRSRAVAVCWAGTRSQAVTIRVHVTRAVSSYDGVYYVQLRAWASPTLRTIGPLEPARKGVMVTQDSTVCPQS
jgi:hypothetical protein